MMCIYTTAVVTFAPRLILFEISNYRSSMIKQQPSSIHEHPSERLHAESHQYVQEKIAYTKQHWEPYLTRTSIWRRRSRTLTKKSQHVSRIDNEIYSSRGKAVEQWALAAIANKQFSEIYASFVFSERRIIRSKQLPRGKQLKKFHQ